MGDYPLWFPKRYFPGTPRWLRKNIENALSKLGVPEAKRPLWRVMLSAISRYESDNNPKVPIGICQNCRGMMQCAIGMYQDALLEGFISAIDFENPVQALHVAGRYIRSELPHYGGYNGIVKLYERNDRGPGEAIRQWIEHPRWKYPKLRVYYHGY